MYTALLRPHDRIMGLDLMAGGHLTHGYATVSKVRAPVRGTRSRSAFMDPSVLPARTRFGAVSASALAAAACESPLCHTAMVVAG